MIELGIIHQLIPIVQVSPRGGAEANRDPLIHLSRGKFPKIQINFPFDASLQNSSIFDYCTKQKKSTRKCKHRNKKRS